MFLKKAKHWLVFDLIRPVWNKCLLLNKTERYNIKADYTPNLLPRTYQDNPEFANEYQIEVYKLAVDLIKKHKLQSVADVGCGHGYKLNKYVIPRVETTVGIDMPESIRYCQEEYSSGTWISDDINQPANVPEQKFDLVMSVDVIEHLINPDNLIAYLKQLSNPDSWVLISTPERDLVRGSSDLGPPPNPAHVREWNQEELAQYLTSQGLEIHQHQVVEDIASEKKKSVPGRNFGKTCQVVIGRFCQ